MLNIAVLSVELCGQEPLVYHMIVANRIASVRRCFRVVHLEAAMDSVYRAL